MVYYVWIVNDISFLHCLRWMNFRITHTQHSTHSQPFHFVFKERKNIVHIIIYCTKMNLLVVRSAIRSDVCCNVRRNLQWLNFEQCMYKPKSGQQPSEGITFRFWSNQRNILYIKWTRHRQANMLLVGIMIASHQFSILICNFGCVWIISTSYSDFSAAPINPPFCTKFKLLANAAVPVRCAQLSHWHYMHNFSARQFTACGAGFSGTRANSFVGSKW